MASDHKMDEFLAAYDDYADALYRHCFFRVYSKARAEELMQETYLKAWQYIKERSDIKIENMRAFLYRVANNLIIDESRKKKEESLDALLVVSGSFEPAYDGGKEMERASLIKDIFRASEELSEEERHIMALRYVDDLDPREIAEVCETTPNNISVKLNRITAKIKKIMELK